MSSVLTRSRVLSLFFTLSCLLASGQAFGQFTTILNIPPDPNIGDSQSIGSDTQLNLFDGGRIGWSFDAGSPSGPSRNVEVNIIGGSVDSAFHAFSGSTVNMSGGSVDGIVDGFFRAHEGSTVNISGGYAGNEFRALADSKVNISGGAFGDGFQTFERSTVNIAGGEFRLNGVPVEGLETVGNTVAFNVPRGSVLNGTLTDGTPFAFSSHTSDRIADGTLTLEAAALPAIDRPLIMLPGDPTPLGIRDGQTLAVEVGGTLGDNINAAWGTVNVNGGRVGHKFEAVGARVNIASGSVGDRFAAFVGSEVNVSGGSVGQIFSAFNGSTVNISSGSIGNYLEVFDGSEVNISGGSIGFRADALDGSTINISGGSIGDIFHAFGGTVNVSGGSVGDRFEAFGVSTVNISGGSVGDGFAVFSRSSVNISGGSVGSGFSARNGSAVNISGGSVGDGFRTQSGSEVIISGGEFRLDGVIVDGLDTVGKRLDVNLPGGSVVSGTLGDGTPFAFAGLDSDTIADGTLTLKATALPAIGPPLIMLPKDPTPLGIRAGQTLVVQDGGTVADNFGAGWGSIVNVEAGATVGRNFEAVAAEVNISGGSVGRDLDAFEGSTVNISGGSVGNNFNAGRGSIVNISGGSVGREFGAFEHSRVNISGGSVGDDFHAFHRSTVNISGGSVAGSFTAHGGSEVNISGGSFGSFFNALSGSRVNISGGSFAERFNAITGSRVNISGGTFGGNFNAFDGSFVNISGGEFRSIFIGNEGSTVNIAGGSFDRFAALDGSTVNLLGTHFVLDQLDITDSLTPYVPFTINERDVPLIGRLADGSEFEFDLSPTAERGDDAFQPGSTLTVTLLGLTGDINGDNRVNIDDLNAVRNNFHRRGRRDGSLQGDSFPFNGIVDINDLNAVRNNFGAVRELPASVPEAGTWAMLAAGLLCALFVRKGRWSHQRR